MIICACDNQLRRSIRLIQYIRSCTVWYGILKRYWYSTVQYQALRVHSMILLYHIRNVASDPFSLFFSTLLSLYLFNLEHDKNQMRHGPPPPP